MDTPAAYAASVNPPRRAKRPRIASFTSSPTDPPQLQPIAPALPALAPAAPPTDSTDPAAPPAPKRRGRKPSTLSRAARESARRQNHSRIEKARRTKINDALGTLRALVPRDPDAPSEDDEEYADSGGKRERKEKEFKLEVLEKTVLYVQELQARVRALEAECASAAAAPHQAPKRKRTRAEEDSALLASPPSEPDPAPQPARRHTSRTRLPSIASWLPSASAQPLRTQLLTPPTSTTLGPTASPALPPALALDLPGPHAAAQSFSSARKAPSITASPPWTPEDESAASLLLGIRSTGAAPEREDVPRVQTPASLLGMNVEKRGL